MYEAKAQSTNDALRLVEQAIAVDSQFSSAHGLKAVCHVFRKAQGWGAVEMAEAHGLQAASLAVETGKAGKAHAGVHLGHRGVDGAETPRLLEEDSDLSCSPTYREIRRCSHCRGERTFANVQCTRAPRRRPAFATYEGSVRPGQRSLPQGINQVVLVGEVT